MPCPAISEQPERRIVEPREDQPDDHAGQHERRGRTATSRGCRPPPWFRYNASARPRRREHEEREPDHVVAQRGVERRRMQQFDVVRARRRCARSSRPVVQAQPRVQDRPDHIDGHHRARRREKEPRARCRRRTAGDGRRAGRAGGGCAAWRRAGGRGRDRTGHGKPP